MAILTANQLSKVYGHKQKYRALNNISFSVEKGEFVAVMGPSGSGKTTLLNVLSSIDTISGGTVEVEGKEINKLSHKEVANFRKQHLGFIFQDYSVLPTLTVKENIMLPLSVQKVGKEEMNRRYNRIVEALNISDISDKYPSELSGGQRQRTSAARAFINLPSIIFADEPTGNLDGQTAQEIERLLFDLNKELGTTLILVTHDRNLAGLCQRHVELNDGRLKTVQGS